MSDIHIPEPTEPNTGRLLDYWLGGHHHFPIDVAAAQAFETMFDDFPGVFRTLRNYIGRTTRFVRNQGIDQFLVFGSGVPASGNVHEVVPDARVLYTDIDRTNVALGQKILEGVSNVDYIYCDASDLSTLDHSAVEKTLGPLRRLGVIFVGLAVFISDDDLRRTFDELYDLCPSGSFMVLDFDSDILKRYPQVIETLKATGAPFFMRTPETIAPLLGRWRLTEEGIQPVAAWGNPEGSDAPAFMYGTVVERA